MKIGFTGTQLGMTPIQKQRYSQLIAYYQNKTITKILNYHHDGDCFGADSEAFFIAKSQGFRTVCHPPIKRSKRAFNVHDEERPPYEYLVRNHHIVDETELLIGTPGQVQEQFRGSGTWATIRYARAPLRKKPLIIIFPDGSLMEENLEVFLPL